MEAFATVNDYTTLYNKTLTASEQEQVSMLLALASDKLRQSAMNVGLDIDLMYSDGKILPNALKEVTCRMVAEFMGRAGDMSTMGMSQITQSALGYSASGTYAVPGGGLSVMKRDLQTLGIVRCPIGAIDLMGGDNLVDD